LQSPSLLILLTARDFPEPTTRSGIETMTTTNELKAGFKALQALAEAIRELKKIPSGHLYARVMNYMDINAYEKAISLLCNSGVIRKNGDMLVWNLEA
jgi:hypothetical protein